MDILIVIINNNNLMCGCCGIRKLDGMQLSLYQVKSDLLEKFLCMEKATHFYQILFQAGDCKEMRKNATFKQTAFLYKNNEENVSPLEVKETNLESYVFF